MEPASNNNDTTGNGVMIRHEYDGGPEGPEPQAAPSGPAAGQPLLRPAELGGLHLPNRVVMAPLTRARATNDDQVPTDLHATYYGQRASAGLMITEGLWVSQAAVGCGGVPGIHSERQVSAWRRVTGLVHALGGRIAAQLWHTGAHAHPAHRGALPGGPSAVDPQEICPVPGGFAAAPVPREMGVAEIERTVAEYASAAEHARRAGFDGVEIAANGTYLQAAFLNPRLNLRTDRYGAPRSRLLLETVDAVTGVWDSGRVGLRLSPYWTERDRPRADSPAGSYPYTPDERTLDAYDALVTELDARSLGWLHLRGRLPEGPDDEPDLDETARFRKLYGGFLIANNGFGRESGNAVVEAGIADAVSFGRPFIANPDLVSRFALGHATATSDPATHYTGGARGYIDQPVWPGPRDLP